MDEKTAKKVGLSLLPTDMAIKPYNSPSKPCLGESVVTVTFGERVANVKFYVVKGNSECLISGIVSEHLGMLKTNCARVLKSDTPPVAVDREKELIGEEFPNIFKGVGMMKDYEVEFHVNKDVKPTVQAQRQVPFHLRGKLHDEMSGPVG